MFDEEIFNAFLENNRKQFDIDDYQYLTVSKYDQASFNQLKNNLKTVFDFSLANAEENLVVTNYRHRVALEKSFDNLCNALESIRKREGGEFVSHNLRSALNHIGEIIGLVTTDELLDHIFSKFCIGK